MNIFSDIVNALPGAVAQGLIWGIMAVGVFITYKILDIADLTVDGSICTGMAVCAVLMTNGVNVWVAMLCSLIAGMLTGLVTGIFHTFMGVPAMRSGISTQLFLWSVNLKILGGANLALPARTYDVIVTLLRRESSIFILIAFVVVLAALLYWFFGTEFGSAVRATGSNIKMSRAQGINTDFNKIFGLVLSNGIVALSGSLLAQYSGSADINSGRGAIVIGLAAVIIGEAIISKISKNFFIHLIGVVLGGVVYYIVYQVVICLKIDTDFLKMLSALVVAVFLAVPYWKKKYFSKPKQLKKEEAPNA